ncbi:hypothetical protein [Parvicella tangerina]|nr:hypothetical protein [Parvicella tangerina]
MKLSIKYISLVMLTLAILISLFSCQKQQPLNSTNNYNYNYTSWDDLSTSFSEDWDNWEFTVDSSAGYFRTAFSEDWDNWDVKIGNISGQIDTQFSEDWDNWEFKLSGYNIDIETYFSNDWDSWTVKDQNTGDIYRVRTSFSEDWDNWEVKLNGELVMDMETDFSNDFDNWQIKNYAITNEVHKACVMFIPVFISAIHQQGRI